MLGFLLGALFVWMLPKPPARPSSIVAPTPERPALAAPPTHPRLSDVEAVFEEWRQYALWDGDTTYVCMWDDVSRTFRDCYEVLRRGESQNYFRNVARPRNLRPRDGVPANSPLEFLNPVAEARGLFGERIAPPVTDRPKPGN